MMDSKQMRHRNNFHNQAESPSRVNSSPGVRRRPDTPSSSPRRKSRNDGLEQMSLRTTLALAFVLGGLFFFCIVVQLMEVERALGSLGSEDPGPGPIERVTGPLLGLRPLQASKPVQQTFDFDSSASLPYVIFYNIYIDPNHPDNGIRVVKEQLVEIGSSYGAMWKKHPVSLFFNTIGSTELTTPDVMKLCKQNNLRCHHMKHYHEAFEEVTLQSMFDFCHTYDSDQGTVVYLHNKGSLNSKEGTNDFWRQHMTAAVMAENCLFPPDETCNVCGLQFWPQWSFMFPGNFFTAKCSYVRKLHPPIGFGERMQKLSEQTLEKNATGKLQIRMFPTNEDQLGVGRFATEHWIGAHPDLMPCDMSETSDLQYWMNDKHDDSEFKWAMAPRTPVSGPFKSWPTEFEKESVVLDKKSRLKEYYLLPGFLSKWAFLYQKFPEDNSWVWKAFPDGEFWKARAKAYGMHLDALLAVA